MRLELDARLPAELAEDLPVRGHDFDTVRGEGLAGAPDTVVTAVARRDGRMLLTLDEGLGNIRSLPPKQYPGTILFRFEQKGRGIVRRTLVRFLPKVAKTSLAGRLVVMTPSSVRTR